MNARTDLMENFIAIQEDDSFRNVRMLAMQQQKGYIVLLDQDEFPIRLISIESFLDRGISPNSNIRHVASKWPIPILADVSTPDLMLVSLLEKMGNCPGIILIEQQKVVGLMSKKSLFTLLSEIQVSQNLQATRFPDVYGIIETVGLPDIACYRCFKCEYRTKLTLYTEIPICEKPWHGSLILTACRNNEYRFDK